MFQAGCVRFSKKDSLGCSLSAPQVPLTWSDCHGIRVPAGTPGGGSFSLFLGRAADMARLTWHFPPCWHSSCGATAGATILRRREPLKPLIAECQASRYSSLVRLTGRLVHTLCVYQISVIRNLVGGRRTWNCWERREDSNIALIELSVSDLFLRLAESRVCSF